MDGRADGPWISHRVPWAASTSRRARALLRSTLLDAGADRSAGDDAELVLAEMIANAVIHGAAAPDGMIDVSWRLVSGCVELRVRDSGHAGTLVPGMPGPSALGGRGLALVEQLSERWSQRTGARTGTEVAATVRVVLPRPRTGP